jgi:outer membrane beta-barrel protein
MKHSLQLTLTILTAIIGLSLSVAAETQKNLKDEFQSLGDNKAVAERVRNLDNQQRVRIVQNRLVDRNNRVELAVNYSYLGGADSYVQSQNVGGMLQYHISPRWSLGAEFQRSYNALTDEGQRQFDLAQVAQQNDPSSSQRFPSVDFPLETKLATISFYPIYGKLNLFDLSVAQFDVYLLLGAGKKTLNSGESDAYAAGLGTGIWLNSWLTSRLEVRYEKYQDLLATDRRDQSSVAAMASLGILIW